MGILFCKITFMLCYVMLCRYYIKVNIYQNTTINMYNKLLIVINIVTSINMYIY